ncbi:hypothetical protein ACFQ9U_16510 [Streptomyces sp. NPDC056568]|uniref:hypothetical protein n=1 Tax=Streptomyces sp. NPDC056568 TaxID=3345866 RepID=UPI0036988322
MTQLQDQPRTRGSGRPRPLTRRLAAVLGCCLAGVTAVTACGGGDGSGTAGSTTSSTPTTVVTSSEPAIDTPLEADTTPTEPEPALTEESEPDEDTYETDTETGTESGTDDVSDETGGVPHGEWTGTALVTVDFADPGCAADSRSYELPATLIIDDPVGTEGNPFHLSWASDDQTTDGAFGVTSAQSGTDTVDGESVEIAYWSLSDDGDGSFSGRLTDTASAAGASLNLLFVPKPLFQCGTYTSFPYGMGTDTTIEGSVTDASASLTVSGTSADGTRSFRVAWS